MREVKLIGLVLILGLLLLGCSLYPKYDQDKEMQTEVVVKKAPVIVPVKEKSEVVAEDVVDQPVSVKEVEVISSSLGKEKKQCELDSDCGDYEIISSVCFQGNVNLQYKDYKCVDGKCKVLGGSKITDCDDREEICLEGECVLIETRPCNDSDGGLTYDVAGKVVDAEGNVFRDECVTAFKLYEAYCASGDFNMGRGAIKEYKCAEGEICSVNYCRPRPDEE